MSMTADDLRRYYDESLPPEVLGIVYATGATAGIPGTWTPAGARAPASVSALQGGNPVDVTASPATPWTTGQFVQTRTAGAAGRATWTGSAWVGGAAPLITPTASWLKADIIAWLLDHGVQLDEEALEQLTKAELLDLAADLVDPEVPEPDEPEGEPLPPPEPAA